MPRRPTGSVPALVHHKASNRARVRINGRDFWLGKWGSPEAKMAYDRLIAEYLATRRILSPVASPEGAAGHPTLGPASVGGVGHAQTLDPAGGGCIPEELTVAELAGLYLEHCRTYYRNADGQRTSTYDNSLQAVRALRPFDDTIASAFGPRRLGTIRDAEASRGRSRVGCNTIVKHVRRVFQWAESQELVPRGTHNSLKTVEPLRQGRTHAPELPPIAPVDDAVVDATLPFLPEIVADMVRLQRLTGARPGEVCKLRPEDIDKSESVWRWRLPTHKNSWRGKDRVIMVGPRAQVLLKRYLLRDGKAFCFSPAESEKKRSRARRLRRQSPMTPSQRARKPKSDGRRRPRDQYDTGSYRRAITRAVDALNAALKLQDPNAKPFEDWAPNRLRHTAGTEVRKKFGLEAAQVVLGHASADITQVYAERNHELAAVVIRQIG